MSTYNLGQLFNTISSKHGKAPAIRFDEEKHISFSELNLLSNRIAHYLLKKNIKKRDVVGIFHNKAPESYCLMMACLKIGAIYVNLDSNSPAERIRKILDKCDPALISVDRHDLLKLTNDFNYPCVEVTSKKFLTELEKYPDNDPECTDSVCSDNPAYIMFTSGSTGFPKGAIMTHQNLLNFINWSRTVYRITKDDILTNVNPMYFDNSVFDFYASLFNGASMAPVDAETVRNASGLVSYVGKIKATIWFSVPSLLVYLLTMKALGKDSFRNIRVITFGGEGFPKPKLKELFDLYGERIEIINVYGPTECTCICSAYKIGKDDFIDMKNLAPLGFMAPNFDYLILDENWKESDKGELILGGPQVGLGYYNDIERSDKSFIQHPFIKEFRKTMYRTGDMVRREQNGMIHITGRGDNQIKYMGYRIELEEIEAGLNSLEYVDEAGVVYEKSDDGLGQIIAYIALKKTVPVDLIRNDIKLVLPSYMVPKAIKVLDRLPRNQNGKIDRLGLKTLNNSL